MVTSVQEIAEAYVKLVLAIGQHDPNYVDAYYGPPEWKKQEKKPLDAIAQRCDTVTRSVDEDFQVDGRDGAVAMPRT